jgi:hypothetical protein
MRAPPTVGSVRHCSWPLFDAPICVARNNLLAPAVN